ncbi:hypothetical protein [Jannaschia sp. W003]|uniref:hypothetical protein n=1 Tax=Jannaschia sp. W003 TaxID=2867012 RepID=UPI0028831FE5|nr:hypothetical protein [Jannaschia sp. W003]
MNVRFEPAQPPQRPIGYFVHHQGRGHAERCAAIARALPASRPLRIFCARPDHFRGLPAHAVVQPIPSLFEARGDEAALDHLPHPETAHCAPVGWPAITEAMTAMADWWRDARPALMVVDVSAEVAQAARLFSVPHVHVLQHGTRGDAGHRAAYDGAAGLLAPCAEAMAQPEWDAYADRIHYAGGLGLDGAMPDRAAARARLGVAEGEELVLVVSGGGGDGFAAAPLGVGARATPQARWVTIGQVRRDWHATEPANLQHLGWVENAADWIAAADLVVASTGNTTVQQVMAAGVPYLAVPEWRYFDEQVRKAEALDAAGLAHALPGLPASADCWRRAAAEARRRHDPGRQRACVDPDAARGAARWLHRLATRLEESTPMTLAGDPS